jgi:hypothetical protein
MAIFFPKRLVCTGRIWLQLPSVVVNFLLGSDGVANIIQKLLKGSLDGFGPY